MPYRNVRFSVAAAAAIALVGGGFASAALAAPHHAKVAHVSTPTIKAVFHGQRLVLEGPTTVPAGAVKITLSSTHGDHQLAIVSFKRTYSLKKFEADAAAFGRSFNQQGQPSQEGLRHLRNAIRHTFAYGGFEANSQPKLHESGMVELNRPGTVYLANDAGGAFSSVRKITVTKSATPTALPKTATRVVATTQRRFSGSKTLPAKGTITFTNKSTESPHFLILQHVKEGTTRKQVIKALQSNTPPSFARPGEESTDFLTYGRSQTLNTNLPRGEYAELCFFPDPQTGMPHALMGMVGIVHLK